jgi:hypothetical protein
VPLHAVRQSGVRREVVGRLVGDVSGPLRQFACL